MEFVQLSLSGGLCQMDAAKVSCCGFALEQVFSMVDTQHTLVVWCRVARIRNFFSQFLRISPRNSVLTVFCACTKCCAAKIAGNSNVQMWIGKMVLAVKNHWARPGDCIHVARCSICME